MDDFDNLWIISIIILSIAFFIRLNYKTPNSRVGNNNQIPKTPNPPPPKFSHKSCTKMSYSNSTDRVKALEALSRAYNLILTMPLCIRTESGNSLLGAIAAEAKHIKKAAENDPNYQFYSETNKSTEG